MSEDSLKELEDASVRMEDLAQRAEGDLSVLNELVLAISEWVDQVDQFVDRCEDPEILRNYQEATLGLDAFLSKLHDPQAVETMEQELPEVVSRWEEAIRALVRSTLS